MSPTTKHIISLAGLALGFALEAYGFSILAGSMGAHNLVVKGLTYMVVGILIGVPSAVFQIYFKQSKKWFPAKEKVETETMAALNKYKNSRK